MTPQQALEEAKKRYTEGTELITVVNRHVISIKDTDSFNILPLSTSFAIIYLDQYAIYHSKNDQWAEIIQPAKSLEERLVEEYGFEKVYTSETTRCFFKNGLAIYFTLNSTELFILDRQITNPNNLEAFIKAYLGLFEK
jgi:hypothetical protein